MFLADIHTCPIFRATGTPVFDFWWHLLWVSKPEWVLPNLLFAEANVMYWVRFRHKPGSTALYSAYTSYTKVQTRSATLTLKCTGYTTKNKNKTGVSVSPQKDMCLLNSGWLTGVCTGCLKQLRHLVKYSFASSSCVMSKPSPLKAQGYYSNRDCSILGTDSSGITVRNCNVLQNIKCT